MRAGFFLALVLVLAAGSARSQGEMLLYNFDALWQSTHLNPATPQQSKIWVGLPFSGLQFGVANSAFSAYDLLAADSDINHNLNTILEKMDDLERIGLSQRTDLLSVGFPLARGQMSVGIYQHLDFNFHLPSSLLRFVGDSTFIFNQLNLDELYFSSSIRTHYYLGFQQPFYDDRLRVALRFNYLVGQVNGFSEQSQFRVSESSTLGLIAESDLSFRASTLVDLENEGDLSWQQLVFPNNRGIAFDLGLWYRLNEQWHFSASLLDLGYLNWVSQTRSYQSQGSFLFEGIEWDLSEDAPELDGQAILDSLEEAFQLEEGFGENYRTNLHSRIFLAANWDFHPSQSLGFLYQGQFFDRRLFSAVSINYLARLSRGFQLTAQYGVRYGQWDNLGLGFMTKAGPFQFYLLSDNLLGLFRYTELQTTNLQIGINLAFYAPRSTGVENQ